MMTNTKLIPAEKIDRSILLIRGQKVILDIDLAQIYGVRTKRLNEQVKRNIGRFPERYAFRLTDTGHKSLSAQNATLKRGQHSKYPPYAFTEHGVLMLCNVLKSERAEKVSLLIVDTFVKLRELLLTNKDILLEIEKIRNKVAGQDKKTELIFKYLKRFITEQQTPRKKIGYKQ